MSCIFFVQSDLKVKYKKKSNIFVSYQNTRIELKCQTIFKVQVHISEK